MYLPSSPFPQTTQTRGGGTLRKQDENKTKKKERKKKEHSRVTQATAKLRGKSFKQNQILMEERGAVRGGRGGRRKGRTEGGGVLPELKKTLESPFKKKKGHDLSGVPGGHFLLLTSTQGRKPPPITTPCITAACSSSHLVHLLLPFI